MDLTRCQQPHGTLERAPATALRPAEAAEDLGSSWEGFWCVADDHYYARCTRANGDVQWYYIRDEGTAGVTTPRARVIPLRRRTTSIVFVSTRRDRVPMLVGVSRRGARRSRRDGGGRG